MVVTITATGSPPRMKVNGGNGGDFGQLPRNYPVARRNGMTKGVEWTKGVDRSSTTICLLVEYSP